MIAKIGNINVDCFVSEGYGYTSETTSYPVEEGPDINDHTRAMPITLSIVAGVADVPLDSELASIRETETGGDFTVTEFVFNQIEDIYRARQPVTVVTSRRVYTNMAMTSCNITQDETTGRFLGFTCEFTQINIVTNKRGQVVEISGARTEGKGFRAAKLYGWQTKKMKDGSTEKLKVYDNGLKAAQRFTYADGTPYEGRAKDVELADKATKTKLDKFAAAQTPKGQTKPTGPGAPRTTLGL